jgi:hypothetical protein
LAGPCECPRGEPQRNEEVGAFREQAAGLNATFKGEAIFETTEGWFSFRLVGDGRGHIALQGTCGTSRGE